MEQKTKLTLGGLFEGIGGFPLAATWAGIEPVWSNEIDPFCCKVLRKNFKHEIIEKDIREIGKHNLKRSDIVSGGFPCQPFSQAGKRKGKSDDRYLWPEMLRVIKELQPSYVIGENVAGLLSMENGETLKGILSDLEDAGYNNEIFIIPACSIGAWHRRDRIWIVAINTEFKSDGGHNAKKGKGIRLQMGGNKLDKARRNKSANNIKSSSINASNTKEAKCEQSGNTWTGRDGFTNSCENVSDTTGKRQQRRGEYERSRNSETYKNGEANRIIHDSKRNKKQWHVESPVGGVAPRLPTTLDGYWNQEPEGVPRVATGITNRVDRLKGLGNAIVPQVAYELFKAIINLENQITNTI